MQPGQVSPLGDDEAMALALDDAELARSTIGAVVLSPAGLVLSVRHEETETTDDPTAHAVVLALRDAAAATGSWRLVDCSLVTTIEPCPMCAGAAVAARVGRVVFGCADPALGSLGSRYNFGADPRLNHELSIVSGVLSTRCAERYRTGRP